MLRDDPVCFYGQDIGKFGGALRLLGVAEAFGARVMDSPISGSMIGMAVGAG